MYERLSAVTKLESQGDLYTQVIRSDDVWLVAFINAERGTSACLCSPVAEHRKASISRLLRRLADTSPFQILDLAAKRLSASSLARVAVINYAGVDYDLRTAWSISHQHLPQLRLFSTRGELPKIIAGLQQDGNGVAFDNLTPAQQSVRAMKISSECMTQLSKHPNGAGVKRRTKSNPLARRKTEL